jgi:hypothetical protein
LALLTLLLAGSSAAWFLAQQKALAGNCESPNECRALVHSTEQARVSCLAFCEDEQNAHQRSQALLGQALERDAARAFQMERQARLSQETEQREQERAAQLAQERDVRAEKHRQRLEMLQAEAAIEQAERESIRARQIAYLKLLSREQRQARLELCHDRGRDCDALIELLIDATTTAAEQRQLIDFHERALRGNDDVKAVPKDGSGPALALRSSPS